MFIFSKCLPLMFSDKFGPKILFQKIVSKDCYTYCMPNFSFPDMIENHVLKVGYSKNKHEDTIYVLFIDRATSVKE